MPRDLPPPPIADREPFHHHYHGRDFEDPYHWLRNTDDPRVLAYLQAENAYTEKVMEPLHKFRTRLYQEMIGRIQETDRSAPYPHGPYVYYSRTVEGREYRILCRAPRRAAAPTAPDPTNGTGPLPGEELLLDVNELARGESYTALGGWAVDDRHERLAYLIDHSGDERFRLRIRDLRTGETRDQDIADATYGLEWGPDGSVYYTRQDEAARPNRIFRHVPGTTTETDTLLFEETDERFFLWLSRSRDDRFLFLSSDSKTTSEIHFLDFREPLPKVRLVHPRAEGLEYDVEPLDDTFYIRANDDGANFRLLAAPISRPGRDAWTEVVPHRPEVLLQGVDGIRDHLVLWEREDGLPHLRVLRVDDGSSHRIEMPEDVRSLSGAINAEFDTDRYRFAYSSPTTPPSVFEYDVVARERHLIKESPVLGGFDHTHYASERRIARAPDGTSVPISIVYRRTCRGRTPMPVLLTGYGAYGADYDLGFDSIRLSLLDRGLAFGVAHVRGGEELGRHWYENGKLLQKRNTFTDLIVAAEHLIAAGLTTSDRLALHGGSAGGLLVGAVLNERPDLFRAAVAEVPFVDVLNTMWDESLPLTVTEFEEWGNPKDRRFFEYIRSYSPYENVTEQEYPHLLVLAGLNDPRVAYWEAAKWTARLRATKRGDQILLLKTNMEAGHMGASGRYESIEEDAYIYAFLLDRLGRRDDTLEGRPDDHAPFDSLDEGKELRTGRRRGPRRE